MAQYTITGYDASAHMSEETRGASSAAAWGMVMSVVVSVIFGFILLVAVTFAVPERGGARPEQHRHVHLADVDEHQMGRVPARHRHRGAVLLRDRVGDVGVADDVRVLARRRRPRPSAVAQGVERDRMPVNTVWAIVVLVLARWCRPGGTTPPATLVGTAIAVIGLYIAFVLPIILRCGPATKFQRGAWHLGKHYKWIDPLAIALDRPHLRPLPAADRPTAASRGTRGFDWNVVNYTPITVGGAFLLFGGWYVISAKKWFKGPVGRAPRKSSSGSRASTRAEAVPPSGRRRRPSVVQLESSAASRRPSSSTPRLRKTGREPSSQSCCHHSPVAGTRQLR